MTAPAQETTAEQGQKLLVIYGPLMLAMLLAALDQTIVSTALPTIVNDLDGLSHLSCVVTAYLLASTATTQVWGKRASPSRKAAPTPSQPLEKPRSSRTVA